MMNRNIFYRTVVCCGLLLSLLIGCKATSRNPIQAKKAPDYFTAVFETTKGNFEIEAKKEWSPMGVTRLYNLIESGYYTDVAIFRVLPDYIAQFGINNDSILNKNWNSIKVEDEVVVKKNTEGTISFARSGPNTRGTSLFINTVNNSPRLDTLNHNNVKGFPGVAQVTKGLDVTKSFYNGYGAELDNQQDSILKYGHQFLRKKYPKLDYIQRAYILKD